MPKHGNNLRLDDGVFVFRKPGGQSFQSYYEEIYQAVILNVERIRQRKTDLHFSVWSSYQERDFKILKS
ncbi:hypothetical protein D0C36_22800 [Mucilaginibacter conchicola]|uniref:Uncharacterized protein n=1 Tax=Mucilaginibacter conchicola TaxID=2303333 RepID=A0A372NMA7_9SPHI|nr:hypothetical protein D0C36_22800 [Mucilaginibacter conchicola]